MKSLPTPILVISSRSEDKNVFKALELGAIDFLAKPANHLITMDILRQDIAAKLRVVRELRLRNIQRRVGRSVGPAAELTIEAAAGGEQKAELVVIGASTGGPSALQHIISSLPTGIDAPIMISQHMPEGFTRAFAERLDRNSQLRVKEAEDGDPVGPGHVMVAPGGMNLTVRKERGGLSALVSEKTNNHKYVPSVNALFESGAEAFADKCLGVVLTGMGNDGAEGVRRIKEAGGQVIAESDKTSIVFGMPKEAINTRKVDEVLNLEDIPSAILKRCRTK
jgi:two-component system chemotaxis response regulator CheB